MVKPFYESPKKHYSKSWKSFFLDKKQDYIENIIFDQWDSV